MPVYVFTQRNQSVSQVIRLTPQITSCLIGRAGFEAKSAQAFPNTLYNESLYNITLQPISRSP